MYAGRESPIQSSNIALSAAWRYSTLSSKAKELRALKGQVRQICLEDLCHEIFEQFNQDVRYCSHLLLGASRMHRAKAGRLMDDAILMKTRLRQNRIHLRVQVNLLVDDLLEMEPGFERLPVGGILESWNLIPDFCWDSHDLQVNQQRLDLCHTRESIATHSVEKSALRNLPSRSEWQHASIVDAFLDSNHLDRCEFHEPLDFEPLVVQNFALAPQVGNPAPHDLTRVYDALDSFGEMEVMHANIPTNPLITSHSITNDPNFGLSTTDMGANADPLDREKSPSKIKAPRLMTISNDAEAVVLLSRSPKDQFREYCRAQSLQRNVKRRSASQMYSEMVNHVLLKKPRVILEVSRAFLSKYLPELQTKSYYLEPTSSYLNDLSTELEVERRLERFQVPDRDLELARNTLQLQNPPAIGNQFEFENIGRDGLDDSGVSFEDGHYDVAKEVNEHTSSSFEGSECDPADTEYNAHEASEICLTRFKHFLATRFRAINALEDEGRVQTDETDRGARLSVYSASFGELIPSGRNAASEVTDQVGRGHAARSFSTLLTLASCAQVTFGCKGEASKLMTFDDIIVRVFL